MHWLTLADYPLVEVDKPWYNYYMACNRIELAVAGQHSLSGLIFPHQIRILAYNLSLVGSTTEMPLRMQGGAPVTQCVKRWPTDLADRVRSSLAVISSQPQKDFHCTQPFIINSNLHCPDMIETLLKRT